MPNKSQSFYYAGLEFYPYVEYADKFEVEYSGFKTRLFYNHETGHLIYYPMPDSSLINSYYNGCFTRSNSIPTVTNEYRPEIIDVVRGLKSYVHDIAQLEQFNVHDIGCGFGAGVWAWQQIGVSASGNEANKSWVEAANPYCEYRLFSEPLRVVLQQLNSKVDFFFSSHVLEHLADPLETLRIVAENISSDGVFYIVVPNNHCQRNLIHGRRSGVDFLTLDGNPNFPMHLNFFTPMSLCKMLRYAGLEPIQIETRPLDELSDCINNPGWRQEVKSNLLGGELFVLACKPDNKLAKRDPLVDIAVQAAYDKFIPHSILRGS